MYMLKVSPFLEIHICCDYFSPLINVTEFTSSDLFSFIMIAFLWSSEDFCLLGGYEVGLLHFLL
jgi:hypothetical protein